MKIIYYGLFISFVFQLLQIYNLSLLYAFVNAFGQNLLKLVQFFRNFDSPRPEGHTVQNNVNRMRLMLSEAWRLLTTRVPNRKCFRVSHDVFKNLFSGRGKAAVEQNRMHSEKIYFDVSSQKQKKVPVEQARNAAAEIIYC